MRQLTIQRTAFYILMLALFAMATRVPMDTDMWWHLRSGEYMIENRTILHDDQFSHTYLGEPRAHVEWGSQIVMYLIWTVAGNLGLALYTAVFATGGMYFLYKMSEGSVYLRAFVLVLGATTAAVFWSARPQMMSFFLSTVIFYLLHLYKREKKDYLWSIPFIMWLWGNLHGGFAIGFIFLAGMIGGEIFNNLFIKESPNTIPWRGVGKLIIISLASTGLLLISPFGIDTLLLPFKTVQLDGLRDFILEWKSPNFQEIHTWPFIIMMISVYGVSYGSHRRFDWTDFGLISLTFFMSLNAGRNIAVFAVVATPLITYHLNEIMERKGWAIRSAKFATPRQARLMFILVAVVLIGVIIKIVPALNQDEIREVRAGYFPVDAVDYLNEHDLPNPMFNSYNWGGYLIYYARDYPVFIDGRTDLYGGFVRTYRNSALGGSNWRDALEEYDIQTIFVEKGSGLDLRLRDSAITDWKLEYEDDLSVIYVRVDAET